MRVQMTRNLITTAAILMTCLLCNGCATRYEIVMPNNARVISKGKPKLIREVTVKNETTGESRKVKVAPYYYFTDLEGRERKLPQTSVLRIHPLSDSKKAETFYMPTDYQKPDYWNKKQDWQKKPWYKRL